MLDSFSKFLIGAALTGLAILLASSAASAAPAGLSAVKGDKAAGVINVHGDDDWDDDDDAYEHRRGQHRHRGGRHVDAPYAHVETGRRVVVDAPFAHVYVGRHGRRIVAPFVDIWVPRR